MSDRYIDAKATRDDVIIFVLSAALSKSIKLASEPEKPTDAQMAEAFNNLAC